MSRKNKHVLCVHEEDDTCRLLLEPLAQAGYDVTTTTILSTALYAAGTRNFDLFVLDRLRLDGMCVEICGKLRGMNPDTPILVYAGPPRGVEPRQLIDAGATHIVAKPHIQELISHAMKVG
jgi:two-component system, OmpR family, alkaline phosphatase synthesis response regulator PhoP